MQGYEQLEFEETRILRNHSVLQESMLKCFDKNRNEIKIGDYVVAVSSEAQANGIEGTVVKIFSDGIMYYITISTYGGKIIEHYGNPLLYEVVQR